MAPILFHVGPFPVYGYGTMLLTAFVVGALVLTRELRRMGLDARLARDITLLAIVFGVTGSKVLSLFEHGAVASLPAWLGAWRHSMTWYGGLLAATGAIVLYLRARGAPLWRVLDGAAPALMIAYGIGRLGCHLSGDGDYGLPTDLPWGTRYDQGLVPPSRAFAGLPEVVARFPGGLVPDSTPCHPTPVYEFGLAAVTCAGLLAVGRRRWPAGGVFFLYLVLASAQRFGVEFIRLNPPIALGFSEAQLIAVALALVGLVGLSGLAHQRLRPARPQPASA